MRGRAVGPRAWLAAALFACTAASAQAVAQVVAPAAPAASAAAASVQIVGKPLDETEQRRAAVAGMVVVDREELDRYGDTSALDVLQRQAGISVEGEQPRLRGLGGGYTLILINGEPAPPGFSLDQLSPAEIERIEIVKGPSAEHGGVAGTINVILRTPPRFQQREWRANLSYRAVRPVGSTSLSWGDRVGEIGFQLPVSVYQWANGGASSVQRVSRTALGEVREHNSAGRDEWRGGGINLSPRMDWRLGEGQTLQWQTFLQRNQSDNRNRQQTEVLQGLAPSVLDSVSATRGSWQMARTQLQWSLKLPEGWRYELKASAERSAGNSEGVFLGLSGVAAPWARQNLNNNLGERQALGARLRAPWREGHFIAAGVDLERSHRSELRRIIENGVELFTGSIGPRFDAAMRREVFFVQNDWTISTRTSLSIGLRGEFIHTDAGSVVDPLTGQQVGQQIGQEVGEKTRQRSQFIAPIAQWRMALDEKSRDVLRASLARSNKLPDLSSLMARYGLNTTYERNTPNTPIAADSAGNPHLRPERAWAFEASYERYVGNGGVASVAIFHRRIDGLIRRRITLESVTESPVPRWVSRPSNVGRANASGLELELKGPGEHWWPMLFAPGSGLQLRSALSVYRSAVEQIDDPDARLEGQPPWRASLGFDRLPLKEVFGYGASLSYTPAYATQQTDLQRLWRDRVRRMDIYMIWRFSRELQLRMSAQNADPVPVRSTSVIEDLDGFSARSRNEREGRALFNINLVLRF